MVMSMILMFNISVRLFKFKYRGYLLIYIKFSLLIADNFTNLYTKGVCWAVLMKYIVAILYCSCWLLLIKTGVETGSFILKFSCKVTVSFRSQLCCRLILQITTRRTFLLPSSNLGSLKEYSRRYWTL